MKPLVPHGSGISEQINITRNGKSIMDLICLLDSTPCLLRLTVKIAFSPEIFFSELTKIAPITPSIWPPK